MNRYAALCLDGPYLAVRPFKAGGLEACAGAVGGVVLDLWDRHAPDTIYCAWEASGSMGAMWGWNADETDLAYRSRRDISARYKAKREPWPLDFLDLVSELMRVLSWMGVTHVHCDDEADDAIAGIVEREGSERPMLIVGADKDLLQLVRHGVDMSRDYRGSDPTPITIENVEQRTALSPSGWTAYLALCGDQVDGIAGVENVGPTKAKRIIKAVPNILDAVDRFAPLTKRDAMMKASQTCATAVKDVAWVYDHLDQLELAVKLVTLRSDSPLVVAPPQKNHREAAEWFAARGLTSIAGRLEELRAPWNEEETP